MKDVGLTGKQYHLHLVGQRSVGRHHPTNKYQPAPLRLYRIVCRICSHVAGKEIWPSDMITENMILSGIAEHHATFHAHGGPQDYDIADDLHDYEIDMEDHEPEGDGPWPIFKGNKRQRPTLFRGSERAKQSKLRDPWEKVLESA